MRSRNAAAAPEPPVMSWLLPARARRDTAALGRYAELLWSLARTPRTGPGDVDQPGALDALDADLITLYAGGLPRHQVLRELAPTVAGCDLPAEPLRRMIDAARDEQLVREYGTFSQLVEHYHREADPLGELTLHVVGQPSPERITLNDWICTGTRLVHHLLTAADQWAQGRCYLPKEDLDRFEVTPDDLESPVATEGLRTLVSLQAERARAFVESGAPLVSTMSGAPRRAVGGHVARLRATLVALEHRRYDPLACEPRAGAPATLWHWLRGLARAAG